MRHHTLAVAIVTDPWALPHRPPGLRRLAEFLGGADQDHGAHASEIVRVFVHLQPDVIQGIP
jgi:hypothetical protein